MRDVWKFLLLEVTNGRRSRFPGVRRGVGRRNHPIGVVKRDRVGERGGYGGRVNVFVVCGGRYRSSWVVGQQIASGILSDW